MEGYGPSGKALVELKARGASVALCVDCGAQAFEALEEARAAELDVIVVDHHQCASLLPAAHALINPNRLDESAEGAAHGHLAAVGDGVFARRRAHPRIARAGILRRSEEPKILDLLDLVALGTVADVARLKTLNRAFVTQGLKVMAARQNIGLVGAGRSGAAGEAAELPRPRLRARAADQRRRAGRQVGPRRSPSDLDRPRGSADHRSRARPPQRGAPGDRDAGHRAGRGAGGRLRRSAGDHRDERRLAPGRDRHRRRTHQGAVRAAGDRHRRNRGRQRQGLGPLDLGRRPRRGGAGGQGQRAADRRWRPRHGGRPDPAARWAGGVPRLHQRPARARMSKDRSAIARCCSTPCWRPAAWRLRYAMRSMRPAPMARAGQAPRLRPGPARLIKVGIVGDGHVRGIACGDDGKSFKWIAFSSAASELGQALLASPARPALVARGNHQARRMDRRQCGRNASSRMPRLLDPLESLA